jgi:hypothetical protein
MRESPVLSHVIAVSSFLSPRSARVYPDSLTSEISFLLAAERPVSPHLALSPPSRAFASTLHIAKAKDCLPRIINSALFTLFHFLSLYFSHTTCLTALDGSRQPPQGR